MSLDTRYVRGAQRLRTRIETIKAGTPFALRAAMEEVGELLLKRTKDRFIREVDPDGIKWKELAPSTLRRKRYPPTILAFRTKILRSTGLLYDSINIVRTSKENFFSSATGAGVRIGITNPEAELRGRAQQNGIKKQRLPQRRFLGIGRLDVKAADSLLRNRISKLLAQVPS